jgi:signal transduction histidine kinase
LRAAAATAIAPVVAFAVNAPWYIVANEPGFSASPASVLSNGVVFVVGDLLGILLVTPPVLALLRALRHRRRPNIGSPAEWAGTAVLLAFGGTIVWAIKLGGYGIRLLPLILAVGAIGVMYGRVHAWVSVVLASGAVLWVTAGPAFDAGELALHLQLTGLVLLGLIAGSYADDQRNMRAELRIRDSALLHAERLKTLRAMSVAVIHELSQPLSTLSIETRYLAKLSNSPESDPEELRTVSALIAQKTENLADMLRRLRNFGAASAEESMIVELEKMVRDVVGIIAPEARSAGVRIVMRLKRDLRVFGRGVELQQALTNLLRNAIAASPGGTVRLVTEATAESVRIEVVNTPTPDSPYQKGMGVGKLIVEAIAEMHGGALVEHHAKCGERRIGLVLPTTRVSGT